MRAAFSALWVSAVVFASTLGGAQERADDVRYSLSWVRGEGAEQCPSGRDLTREVERRIGRPVFDRDGPRSFEVQVDRQAGSYHSLVYVRGADGQSLGRRALESSEASCGPIFEATVLAIALVIDPDAAPPAERGGAVAAFAPLAGEGTTPGPAGIAPVPPISAAVARAPSVVPEAPLAAPRTANVEHRTAIAARGLLSSAIVPGASAGVALHFSVRAAERWEVAVGALYLAPSRALSSAGEVRVGLTSATLDATFEAAATNQIRLVLEAGAWAGVLQSTVLRPTPNGSGPFPFLAVDGGARVELAITRGVFAEIGAIGLVPLVRRELLVAPAEKRLWREPALGGLGFFGLGASFL